MMAPFASAQFIRRRVLSAAAMILLIFTGAFYRINDQGSKSFWVDEVWRAQQITLTESYTALQAGEYFGMEAPVQFSEYLFGSVGLAFFGSSEIAFRLWPALFSFLSMLLLAWLSIKTMRPHSALLALTLFCLSPGLVEHAHEFKPYTFEVFLTLLVLCWYFHDWREVWRQLLGAVVLIAVVLFGSNLWPFLLPLFFPFLFRLVRRNLTGLQILVGALGAALCGLLAVPILSRYVEGLQENKIFDFWDPYFLDSFPKAKQAFGENLPNFIDWYVDGPLELWPESRVFGYAAAAVVFVGIPTAAAFRSGRAAYALLSLLWLPLIFGFLGFFPPFTRVGAFMTVPVVLGVGCLVDVLPLRGRWFEAAAGAVVLILCTVVLLHYSPEEFPGARRHIQPVKELVQVIERQSQSADLVVADYPMQLSFRFYQLPPSLRIVSEASFPNRSPDDEEIREAVGLLEQRFPGQRVWLVASHRIDGYARYQQEMRKRGHEILYDWQRADAFGLLVRFQE